jgi:uncharacterized cupredoxin-like copper-binding protein
MRDGLQGLPRGLTALLLACALLLGGCGGAATPTNAGPSFSATNYDQQIAVAADPKGGLRWDKQEYEAKAGAVTFVVRNDSTLRHNFVIEGNGLSVVSPTFGARTTQSYSLPNLAAGEYQIVCTLPGHREGGMVARLTVR